MDNQGRPAVPGGIPEQEFYVPDDDALQLGIAELATLIGPEKANAPSMVRRLVRAKNNDVWLLVIADCCFVSYGDAAYTAPHLVENATTPIRFGHGLAEGIAILGSDSNPEKEIARRAALIDAKAARDKAHADEARRAEQERQAVLKKAQTDAIAFRKNEWEALTSLERALFLLAARVKADNPALAADIHAVAEASRRTGPTTKGERDYPLPTPQCEWWT